MGLRLAGLWRHSDFVKLWTGQTISLVGSAVTTLALPLTAVLLLQATPAQMGLLAAVEAVPSLLLGLFVGVWVDHHRRRAMLIAADIGRAVLLASIPCAALLGMLHMGHLYVVAFLVGALSLSFDVAQRSFLPTLVGRERLVEGNSRLELSRSVAEIAGPGLAGALVQLVTAPLAIAVDAASFLASALFLGWIRAPEPLPPAPAERQKVGKEIGTGLRFVAGNRLLRTLAGCVGLASLFNSALEAVFILYLTRELRVAPGLLGLIMAGGSVGFLIGTFLPGWVTRRLGLGLGISAGLLAVGLSDLLIPLAGGPLVGIVLLLAAAQFFFGLGLVVFNTGQVSLRQAVTPDALQGRMNATMSLLMWGVVPLGGLLGGALGEVLGLRAVLLLGALGEVLTALWLLATPLRSLREAPPPAAVAGVSKQGRADGV